MTTEFNGVLPIRGYTFGFGARKGDYLKEETYDSLDKLCSLNVNWIALAFDMRVPRKDSLEIRYDFNRDITDYELEKLIGEIHSRGIKICLKPMLNSKDHEWRARINFFDDQGSWDKWFYEYKGYILHYAEIAERTGCEMYCLGCELLGTERQEKHWRDLIEKVREVYHGPITYNTNHGHELDAKWYDALDYVGTSGYFPVAKEGGASEEEMIRGWQRVSAELKSVSEKLGKPLLFMEIGCRSARGSATMPWDYMHHEFPYDEDEQANYFSSAIKVLKDEPWFLGFFWWDWSIRLYDAERGKTDTGFATYGKKAADVLKEAYTNL